MVLLSHNVEEGGLMVNNPCNQSSLHTFPGGGSGVKYAHIIVVSVRKSWNISALLSNAPKIILPSSFVQQILKMDATFIIALESKCKQSLGYFGVLQVKTQHPNSHRGKV